MLFSTKNSRMRFSAAVRNAAVALAGSAKGIAGDDGNVLLFQKLCAELLTAHAGALDAGEGVERTARLKAGQAHIVQRLYHIAAAAVIFITHHLNRIIAGM